MAYTMTQISKSCYRITQGREKVGMVTKQDDGSWVASLRNRRTEKSGTAVDAFKAAVKTANRIALCGEDDELKARAALRKENDEVRREIDEMNTFFGFKAVVAKTRKVAI